MKLVSNCLLFVACSAILGCSSNSPVSPATDSASSKSQPIVLVSVQSNVNENPQSIDMAMKLAGFSVDEGRKVAMFFNVKGVDIPTKEFGDAVRFKDNDPIKGQLKKLIERGVEVHVCPICMEAYGIKADDIMKGAFVTTRPKLFGNIGSNTSVFTY